MSDTKLKCPFCNKKLDNDDMLCSCINEYCEESFDMVGTEMMWQKVIDLKEELDRTRKTLDVALDALQLATNGCDSVIFTNQQKIKEINKIIKKD